MREWVRKFRPLAIISAVFALFYFLPVGNRRLEDAVFEGLYLARWYAREHVILCLLPAFFIAGAIATFVSQAAVIKYLGARAGRFISYSVASVSGSILAVCSCTILPLFAGIRNMGAGLGPAITFLYAGPAINVMAIILTARILGLEIGIARAVGAIIFSVIIGAAMHLLFERRSDDIKDDGVILPEEKSRPLWQNVIYFALMVGILVFATLASSGGSMEILYKFKWVLTSLFAGALLWVLILWMRLQWWKAAIVFLVPAILYLCFPHHPQLVFIAAVAAFAAILAISKNELRQWWEASYDFARQIMPLLFAGILVAGFLMGRPGHVGIIPGEWITASVGGNSAPANLLASVVGAFMYFATLTEVPILQGLMASGMGKGPALALLLSGPAVSLPNLLVIGGIIGIKRTAAFTLLVIVLSAACGMLYGAIF